MLEGENSKFIKMLQTFKSNVKRGEDHFNENLKNQISIDPTRTVSFPSKVVIVWLTIVATVVANVPASSSEVFSLDEAFNIATRP